MKVKASSFADPADVRAFKRCKENGGSDAECFKVGDNGIGVWGGNCAEGSGPCCALPPDDMIEKWGSINAAQNRPVRVTVGGEQVVCTLRDRMPWKKNIRNGAGVDLNPDACAALGLRPPVMADAEWEWA